MALTICGTAKRMRLRHLVGVLMALSMSPSHGNSQQADWRTSYAAAQAALEAEDHETYAREMEVMEILKGVFTIAQRIARKQYKLSSGS